MDVKAAMGAEVPISLVLAAPAAPPKAGPAKPPPPLPPVPEPSPERSLVPLVILGAASAVSLGVGIATTIASNSASSDADAQRAGIAGDGGHCAGPPAAFADRCAELGSSLSSIDTLGNVARVAYVASGALAIGAVAYALWPAAAPAPAKTNAGRAQVVPRVGPEGAGFVVRGAW